MTNTDKLKAMFPDTWRNILENNPEIDAEAPAGARDGIKASKQSKYHNTPTELNGRRFDSGKEAARAAELQPMEKAHEIFGLCYQVRFPIQGGTYVADFMYSEVHDGKLVTVVEDSKGFKTPIYRRSKRQMKVQYGIEIKES